MNDQRARELLLDYHRGSLSAADAAALRAYLATHPALQQEFDELGSTFHALDAMPSVKPTPRLRAGVFAAIEAEKRESRVTFLPSTQPRTHRPEHRSFWLRLTQPLAACALLALGFMVGARHATLPPATPPATTGINAETQRELTALREQVNTMSQLVGYSLLQHQQRPTNERLKTVLASANLENPNDKVINELIGSLALDPSANVRLTALEALYPHANQEVVRAGVLSSLPREPSPLVQVAMIDFLVAARDREAAPTLDKLSRNDTLDRSVRAAAVRALTQL
jgi:anti-sigma factor RsiW